MCEACFLRDIYLRLEECLGENDRDWRKCQEHVKALRDCNARLGKTDTEDKEEQTR